LCVFWGGGGWGRISRVKSVSSNMKLVCHCCASVCVRVCVCVCEFLDEWVLLFLSSLIYFQVSRPTSNPQPSTSSTPPHLPPKPSGDFAPQRCDASRYTMGYYSFICVTSLIHMCNAFSLVWHDSVTVPFSLQGTLHRSSVIRRGARWGITHLHV